jgi:hypothetical protein
MPNVAQVYAAPPCVTVHDHASDALHGHAAQGD